MWDLIARAHPCGGGRLAKVADFHCTLPRPRRLDEAPAGAEGGAEDGPRQAQPPAPPLYTAMQLLLGDTARAHTSRCRSTAAA